MPGPRPELLRALALGALALAPLAACGHEAAAGAGEPPRTITRPTPDGPTLTADLYEPPPPVGTPAEGTATGPAPLVVCLHMASSSRGEYRAIAPELVRRGFRVLAVDLRSGHRKNGVNNRTAADWQERTGRERASYAEAWPDVEAAVEWARELAPEAPLALLGSSYSASLALVHAARHPGAVDLVVALSPGEYTRDWTSVAAEAAKVTTPVYITCGNGERERAQAGPIAAAIPAEHVTAWFPPDQVKADHGSRTLVVADPASRAEQWRHLDAALATLR